MTKLQDGQRLEAHAKSIRPKYWSAKVQVRLRTSEPDSRLGLAMLSLTPLLAHLLVMVGPLNWIALVEFVFCPTCTWHRRSWCSVWAFGPSNSIGSKLITRQIHSCSLTPSFWSVIRKPVLHGMTRCEKCKHDSCVWSMMLRH